MTANQKLARTAGVLYLIVAITGGFAHLFVRGSLIVPDDAAATVKNITENEFLFRLGFVSDLVNVAVFLVLPLVLYKLLKPVNPTHALLMVLFVVVTVPIMCLNMLNQFAALLILRDADYLKVFNTDQLDALVLFFMNMHEHGYLIAQIFFGLWLFPLGYLAYQSGFFPKILGVMLMLGTVGYLIDFFVRFLFPDYEVITYPGIAVAGIAEISFCLWLVVKGIRVPKVQAAASLKPVSA